MRLDEQMSSSQLKQNVNGMLVNNTTTKESTSEMKVKKKNREVNEKPTGKPMNCGLVRNVKGETRYLKIK